MGLGNDVFKWLGIDHAPNEPEVLDSIVSALDHLDARRARYLSTFAYLLGRVALADHEVTEAERDLMLRLVANEGALAPDEAAAVVRLAVDEFRRLGGTHNLIVAREFVALTTIEERLALLRCLFAVSAADESVLVREDNEIRQISRELKIEHGDFIRARAEVRDHLAVLNRQR